MKAFVRYIGLLTLGTVLLQGCAFFARKPSLPRQASVERLPKPATETDFSAEVQDADIIYFPTERAASGGRSEPAALLLEALEKRQQPFAIGWDMIGAAQQPLLDQLEAATGSMREQLIAQLDLMASGRAREHCRAVLREARTPGVQFLALGAPRELLAKISTGERLTPEEEKLLPRGYKVVPAQAGYHSSQVELVELEFVAEAIVRAVHTLGTGNKLLIFASGQGLEVEAGLPYFVAQKINARQLVFGPNKKERPKLLTLWHSGHMKVASKS